MLDEKETNLQKQPPYLMKSMMKNMYIIFY